MSDDMPAQDSGAPERRRHQSTSLSALSDLLTWQSWFTPRAHRPGRAGSHPVPTVLAELGHTPCPPSWQSWVTPRAQARIQGVGAGAGAHPWDGDSPLKIYRSIAFKHQFITERPPLGEILYPPLVPTVLAELGHTPCPPALLATGAAPFTGHWPLPAVTGR